MIVKFYRFVMLLLASLRISLFVNVSRATEDNIDVAWDLLYDEARQPYCLRGTNKPTTSNCASLILNSVQMSLMCDIGNILPYRDKVMKEVERDLFAFESKWLARMALKVHIVKLLLKVREDAKINN